MNGKIDYSNWLANMLCWASKIKMWQVYLNVTGVTATTTPLVTIRVWHTATCVSEGHNWMLAFQVCVPPIQTFGYPQLENASSCY